MTQERRPLLAPPVESIRYVLSALLDYTDPDTNEMDASLHVNAVQAWLDSVAGEGVSEWPL